MFLYIVASVFAGIVLSLIAIDVFIGMKCLREIWKDGK